MANALRLISNRVPLESVVVRVIVHIAFRLIQLRRSHCTKTFRVRCPYEMRLSVIHSFIVVQPVYLQESRPLAIC